MNDEYMNLPLNEEPEAENTEADPKPSEESSPVATPEITPENIPEQAPPSTPELAPAEVTPESAPQVPQPELAPTEPTPELNSTEVHPELPFENSPQSAYGPAVTNAPPYAPHYSAPYQAPTAPPYTPNYGSQQTAPYTPMHGAPEAKKKSAGAKVMLICLWVLLGLFSVAIIGTCGYYMGLKNQSDLPIRDNPLSGLITPTETTEAAEEITETVDNSYLYGDGEIVLNKYPSDKSDSTKYNNQTAFEKISPSAVGIMCYKDKEKSTLMGQGTGIIVNTEGYIVTNSHVIGDSKSAYIIDVILSDGNTYDAKVVGYDTRTDLAVVKITAENLVPAEFADSDLISIGEDVIAVGNPGGIEFQNTLTRGVISAKDRTLDLSTQVKYIQTDAAINPGNSGGPLCNLFGQVIGVNSAKIASEEYEGMGFAIPSRTVKEVVDDLIKQGFVSGRVKIGITGTAVTASEAQYNNVPQGILISEIIKGGPCDNGEVKTGDIVVALDDYEIKSFNDIYTALMNYSDGDKATLKLYRMETDEYIETRISLQADDGSTTAD